MRISPAQCLILATLVFVGAAGRDARGGVTVPRSPTAVQQEEGGAPPIEAQPARKAGPKPGKMEFQAVCEPEITSLEPAGEVRAGVTILTLRGKCFGQDRGRYSLAVKPAGKGKQTFNESSWSDGEIRFTLPALPELAGPESTMADLGIVVRSTKKWKDVIRKVPVIGAATPAGPRMTVKTGPAADPAPPKPVKRRTSGFLTRTPARTAAPGLQTPQGGQAVPFTDTSPAGVPPGTFALTTSPPAGPPQFGGRNVALKGGGAAPPVVPRSGEMPGIDPSSIKDSGLRKLPPLELQVRQGSGDFASWGHTWQENMPFIVDFRWKTSRSNVGLALWQLSSSPGFDPKYIYAQRELVMTPEPSLMPERGKFYGFSVDMREISGLPDRSYFYVRITAVTTEQENVTSMPVILHIGEQPEQTAFGLTRLTVVFDEVEVKDDSDDLSEGDLHFAFWIHGQAPQHFHAGIATDESAAAGVTASFANPPNYVTLGAFGCDDDDEDYVGGWISHYYGLKCRTATKKAPEMAEGSITLITGTAAGLTELGVTPFTISAFSDDLWFRVHGRYWMTTE